MDENGAVHLKMITLVAAMQNHVERKSFLSTTDYQYDTFNLTDLELKGAHNTSILSKQWHLDEFGGETTVASVYWYCTVVTGLTLSSCYVPSLLLESHRNP